MQEMQAEDVGLIPKSARSPGGGIGNPLQYVRLAGKSHGWRSLVVYRVTKSWTQQSD